MPSTPRSCESCGVLKIYFAPPFRCSNTVRTIRERNRSSATLETQSKPDFSVSTSTAQTVRLTLV
jgi:hypothetical protein